MKDIFRAALLVLAIIVLITAINAFVDIDYAGIFKSYGLAGVFLLSLVSSTIFFTFPGEFALLLAATTFAKEGVLIVGTLGAVIGSSMNYYIGKKGITAVRDFKVKRDGKDERKASGFFSKYGNAMVFLAPFVPFLGDAITVVAGALRMDFKVFIALNLFGRLVKNALLLYVFASMFGF